jgi:hypothetical protein
MHRRVEAANPVRAAIAYGEFATTHSRYSPSLVAARTPGGDPISTSPLHTARQRPNGNRHSVGRRRLIRGACGCSQMPTARSILTSRSTTRPSWSLVTS